MSNLTNLPKGDSAWLLRKAIQRVAQQINALETNINPAATGGSLNTQVLYNNNGVVRGDSGLTYNPNTDTLSFGAGICFGGLNVDSNTFVVDALNNRVGINKANPAVALDLIGDASISGNLTITGSFAALGGENASAIRAAASDYAAVAFDGATASTRITSTLTGQNIGTGDFSIWQRVRIPAANPSNSFAYAAINNVSNSAFDSSGAFGISQEASGAITVFGYVATVFTVAFTVTGVITNYGGQIVDLVLTRSTVGGTSTLTLYINGTSVGSSTAAVASQSVTTGFLHSGVGAGKQPEHRCYRSVLFNRALSAGDVTELITTGVNPADQWGTQTDIINASTLNGGFETAGGGGADVFADWVEVTSGSSTINRDTSIFYAGTASCRFDLDISSSSVAIQSATATLARNKRYRVSCFARSTATNGRLSFNVGSASFSAFGAVLDNASWQERVLEFVTEGGGTNTFTISRFTGALNGSIWIDNVTFTRIGAIVDLDFTVGTGYQATDRSTNALHGTLFNGVEFTQPKQVAVLYATTNTNGNQQMLGTLAIPTNAVIEDIIVNSTGSATVSIGNASAGTQIVNGASVVSGRQKLTLATPFSTTGNLWVNSSTTATLQFTILYTVAA